MSLHPEVRWAQRKDRVFITIELADIDKHQINLTPEGLLTFSAERHGKHYAFETQLFDIVTVEDSRWNTKGRNIILSIAKGRLDEPYWPRLTKDKAKNAHIQADWSKWVDEDEEG